MSRKWIVRICIGLTWAALLAALLISVVTEDNRPRPPFGLTKR